MGSYRTSVCTTSTIDLVAIYAALPLNDQLMPHRQEAA